MFRIFRQHLRIPIVNFYYTVPQNPKAYCSTQTSPCGNSKSYHQLMSTQQYLIVSSFHYAAMQDPNIYCPTQTSPCGNSTSWSWHQICDPSFFSIAILALLKVKFCMIGFD